MAYKEELLQNLQIPEKDKMTEQKIYCYDANMNHTRNHVLGRHQQGRFV
jgi:hypothetical protein